MTDSVTLEPMGAPIQAKKINDHKFHLGYKLPPFGRLPIIAGGIPQPLGAA
jgi:hypothetical protein